MMELDLSSQAVAAITGALLVILLISYSAYNHVKRCRALLPPMMDLTRDEVRRHLVEGNIHRYFFENVSELGLVFRIRQELDIGQPHIIVCDSALARLILEGDSSKHTPPGEKHHHIKYFNSVTMNTPSILSKQTHGEG